MINMNVWEFQIINLQNDSILALAKLMWTDVDINYPIQIVIYKNH